MFECCSIIIPRLAGTIRPELAITSAATQYMTVSAVKCRCRCMDPFMADAAVREFGHPSKVLHVHRNVVELDSGGAPAVEQIAMRFRDMFVLWRGRSKTWSVSFVLRRVHRTSGGALDFGMVCTSRLFKLFVRVQKTFEANL